MVQITLRRLRLYYYYLRITNHKYSTNILFSFLFQGRLYFANISHPLGLFHQSFVVRALKKLKKLKCQIKLNKIEEPAGIGETDEMKESVKSKETDKVQKSEGVEIYS